MLTIGCHLSSSKGFLAMGRTALDIGANTFQFFTRSPRGGAAKALDPQDVADFLHLSGQHGIGPILAHAAYTLNPCSPRAATRSFALESMHDDLKRLQSLPQAMYAFHPGSHVGQGVETGINHIVAQLDTVITPDATGMILLETMSGKGSEIGGTFEELREILTRVRQGDSLGVCLDTCHVHDAGYDIAADLDGVLTTFDRIIGLDRLRAVHLNDSKNPCGSRKDRHAPIGQGFIGLDAFRRIVTHSRLRHLPFYLETPNDPAGYRREIALLRDMVAGSSKPMYIGVQKM